MRHDNLFKILLILSALFVGLIYAVLPNGIRYYSLRAQGEEYIPLTRVNADVMNTYAPRYRDMIDGTLISGEIDTYEYRNGPALWPMLPALVLAPFFLPFTSVFPGLIITDFVFPVATFLLFFLLIRALTGDRFYALFFALWLMFYSSIILYIPPFNLIELKVLILKFFPFLVDKVPMTPKYLLREAFIPGAPFFLLALYFTYKAVSDTTKKNLYSILAGIFYGLLFYLYFFFWVFATVFLGLFFLFLLIPRKLREARMVFVAGVVGLTVSIPFWINYITLAKLSQYQEIIDRVVGVELGHVFRWGLWMDYLSYAGIAALSLWLGKKLGKPVKALFLAALALAGIAVLNVQVVSGFNVQSDHWFSRVFIITHSIIWASIAYDLFLYFKPTVVLWMGRHRGTLKAVLCLAVLYFSASILYNQIIMEKRAVNNYTVPSSLLAGYAWLNAHTPNDSVVLTPALETNMEIPVYTHNRIFLARAHNSLAPDDELLDRLYISYKLFNIPTANLDEMIQSFEGVFHFFTVKYYDKELDAYLAYSGRKHAGYALPREVREKVLNGYTFFHLPKQIPYRFDYIFIGPYERNRGVSEEFFKGYERVYNRDGVIIYKADRL